MADFPFSKFTEDPELAKRGGAEVYRQWLINSFEKQNKFYAVAEEKNGKIEGYLLHSYSDRTCIIELVAVSSKRAKGGIGTKLFGAIEHSAYKRGCSELKVGTQVRNVGAINFYHKVGCKQVGCHEVYHLWNL
jgi:dTDP-4-amino-4,6-dideoxy-D-galactose acyltransferase